MVRPCITADDIVLVREKNTPRNQWLMGRVVSAPQSKDGLVRKVELSIPPLPGKSSNRKIIRGITDLVMLIPAEDHGKCYTAH